MESPKYELRTVYFYSKYCNLKCRHCWINPPYSDTVSVKDDEASLEEIILALEECRRLGMNSRISLLTLCVRKLSAHLRRVEDLNLRGLAT